MLKHMTNVFESSGVKEDVIDKITKELRESRTNHATLYSPERIHYESILKKNPDFMRKLIRMFYYDYILFGIQIPNVQSL